jgi:hypothetical protein
MKITVVDEAMVEAGVDMIAEVEATVDEIAVMAVVTATEVVDTSLH